MSLSFADYIEVGNRFSAQFSDEVEIHYTYTATGDGNLNPIVFEESRILTEESGRFVGSEISFYHKNTTATIVV